MDTTTQTAAAAHRAAHRASYDARRALAEAIRYGDDGSQIAALTILADAADDAEAEALAALIVAEDAEDAKTFRLRTRG